MRILTFGLLLEEFLAGAGAAGGFGVWHCLFVCFFVWVFVLFLLCWLGSRSRSRVSNLFGWVGSVVYFLGYICCCFLFQKSFERVYLLSLQINTLNFYSLVCEIEVMVVVERCFFLLYLLGRREAENGKRVVDERRHDIEYVVLRQIEFYSFPLFKNSSKISKK